MTEREVDITAQTEAGTNYPDSEDCGLVENTAYVTADNEPGGWVTQFFTVQTYLDPHPKELMLRNHV